ncbi:MAG: hypothetical protein WC717_05330 [Candidatus Micrarchaeia archaeon]|jgi:hypothetical protein
MTIYTASRMPKLPLSRSSKDQFIVGFSKRKGIVSLSYKDYKYLLCALYVDGIERKVSGAGLKDVDVFLEIWLMAARADSQIEAGKKSEFGSSANHSRIPANMDSLLEADASAKDFREYVEARVALGFGIAEYICNFTRNQSSAEFWKNLSAATMLFDTLIDYRKDRKDGLAKDARLGDFAFLARKLLAFGCKAVAKLGMASSLKHLSTPFILTLTGGFESDGKKQKAWQMQETGQISLESTQLSAEYQALK